ncbi:disease resistance protein TAO1-like [Panicum virgatum]|uniref:disease resistance protein TAO1-like n=1 Tax=Panicum virgatum TaxID=38727 RepID=UPI0019D54622|nr:disease resistance protein TAO1-like [Panicum virgatum]XP_039823220.1 disease resistance protein TAO1-like [Panicum virgatum]XP_039823221.1 disease resistance protein TAO1-like [Panicum virgatum]XP_039823222.1 disease resistance protein TAO1-like [Panicum virgatum]XP_039823223.1 disease resistance protein TAO1-like [Panicum virgatum]
MLTTIKLFGGQFKHLPVLGGLPSLKNLHVGYTDSVEDIGRELFIRQFAGDEYFPSLTNLEFMFFSEWSEWSGVDDGEPPCLNELSLLMCDKLSSLPLGPLRCLVILNIRECHNIATLPALLALRELKIAGCSSLSEIPTLPSLSKLDISKCRNLSSIGLHPSFTTLQPHSSSDPGIGAVSSLAKLTECTLATCPNLSAVCYLPSLSTLDLMFGMRDELLYCLLNDLPSLNSLKISSFDVTSIHLKHKSLPSLTRLCLMYCPNLQYCDGLPSLTSLEHLEVRYCPKLPIYNLHPSRLKTLIIKDK